MKYVFDLKKVVLGVTDFLQLTGNLARDLGHPPCTNMCYWYSFRDVFSWLYFLDVENISILLHNHNAPPLEHGVLE